MPDPFSLHLDIRKCQRWLLEAMKYSNCKAALRILALFSTVGTILLVAHLRDLGDQYGVVDYFTFSVSSVNSKRPPLRGSAKAVVGDKVIVMAKMEHEDTSWVAEELSDWQRAIYTVNPSASSADVLTTSANKGHEAMAYLTYIIDNYNLSLPSTMAFLHSHRKGFLKAWHTDSPMHDNVDSLRSLQLPFVARNGYVNLRCNWNPGCGRHNSNTHVSQMVWEELFNETSTPPFDDVGEWRSSMPDAVAPHEKAVYLRGHTAAACCAQFAVSRDQVLQRPIEDYIKFREWVYKTERSDAKSGRVMEFLWHVIFGKDSVYCPDEDVCYCSVYGRC